MESNNILSAALWYANEYGWRVFPLASRDKFPLKGSNGCNDATTDNEQIRAWFENNATLNIGIATGRESDLVVIDIDNYKTDEDPLINLELETGDTIESNAVVVSSPGGGKHLYFSYDDIEDPIKTRSVIRPGLDIRADGGYVVAPPSVHPNGGVYSWHVDQNPGEMELNNIPEATGVAIRGEVVNKDGEIVPVDFSADITATTDQYQEVMSALSFIPSSLKRDAWVRVGMAIKTAIGENGFPLWLCWSAGCPDKFDQTDAVNAWRSFTVGDFGITEQTLWRIARDHGWTGYSGGTPLNIDLSCLRDIDPTTEEEPIKPPFGIHSFKWFNPDDEKTMFLVDNLVHARGVACWFSPPNVGKSPLLCDLAVALTSKRETFLNCPIRDHGTVVYIASEDGDQINKRITAQLLYDGMTRDDLKHELLIIPEPAIFNAKNPNELEWRAMIEMIHSIPKYVPEERVSLVIVDTMSQITVGDETAGEVRTFINELNKLSTSLQCGCIFAHHPAKAIAKNPGGQAWADTPRGGSTAMADVRGVVQLKDRSSMNGDVKRWQIGIIPKKMKGANQNELEDEILIKTAYQKIGKNQFGVDVGAPVVDGVEAAIKIDVKAAKKVEKQSELVTIQSEYEDDVYRTLYELKSKVKKAVIRAAILPKYEAKGTLRSTFNKGLRRALASLIAKGAIFSDDKGDESLYWINNVIEINRIKTDT